MRTSEKLKQTILYFFDMRLAENNRVNNAPDSNKSIIWEDWSMLGFLFTDFCQNLNKRIGDTPDTSDFNNYIYNFILYPQKINEMNNYNDMREYIFSSEENKYFLKIDSMSHAAQQIIGEYCDIILDDNFDIVDYNGDDKGFLRIYLYKNLINQFKNWKYEYTGFADRINNKIVELANGHNITFTNNHTDFAHYANMLGTMINNIFNDNR